MAAKAKESKAKEAKESKAKEAKESKAKEAKASKAPQEFFPVGSNVIQLSKDDFATKTSKKNQVYWVLFYSPRNGESKKLKDEWLKLADEMLGMVQVGAVDCVANKALCLEQTGKEVPVIKIYTSDKTGSAYEGTSTAQAMSDKAKKLLPDTNIETQTVKDHKAWLNKHKAVPRAILFTEKKDVPPIWRAMSMQFNGRMAFGLSRKAERKLNRQYSIKEYPAMVVIPVVPGEDDADADDEDDDDDDAEGNDSVIEYQGMFTASAVQAWLDKYALEDPDAEDEPLPIDELVDDSCLQAYCVNAPGLCAVMITSVNPDKPDKRKLSEEVGIWKQIKDLRKDNLYSFAWMNGLAQMEFLDKALHIQPRDYPQVVVMAGRKLRYATFVGAFAPDSVESFLNGVQKSKIPTIPMGLKALTPLTGNTEVCKGLKVNAGKSNIKKADPEEDRPQMRQERGHRGGTGPVKLDHTNFNKYLLNSRAPWILAFVDGGEGEFVDAFTSAATAMRNMVKFGLVDISASTENRELAEDRYGVSFFPSIRVFKHGIKDEDSIPSHFTGTSTDELVAKGHDLIKGGEAMVPWIDTDTLNPWIQHAPLNPRIVIFTSKKGTTPDILKALALEFFSSEVLIGVSHSKETAKTFGVTKFPSVAYVQGEMAGEPNEKGESKIGLKSKVLPALKLDYNTLSQVCDELADIWKLHKAALLKKQGGEEGGGEDEEEEMKKNKPKTDL